MRYLGCASCTNNKTTEGETPDGWEVDEGVVTCVNCRIDNLERERREITQILNRLLSSDLIRKEACKSFHEDLDEMFPEHRNHAEVGK